MKIELKKIKINLTFSEETTMFQAELAVNGVVIGHANNDGRGGCTDYRVNLYGLSEALQDRNKKLLKEAEAYCKALPPIKYSDFTLDMDLEHFIDDLVTAELEKKEQKKMEKKMEKSILWGKPKGLSYSFVSYSVPLSQVPTAKLQEVVNKYKKQLKDGEVFLNTNFESLGIKI